MTMEDILDNNTNDFKPTKELGDLARYAAEDAFGVLNMWASIEKFTRFDHSTISMLFDGTWTVKSDYIRLLSLCICRIRRKKVKLKHLPVTLPNRDVLESLEMGLEEDIDLYKKTITELCNMPDKSSKNSKFDRNRIVLYKGEDVRKSSPSSLYRQTNAHNSPIFNNSSPSSIDFEYGITDT